MPVYQDKTTGKYYFTCYYVDWQGERRRKVKRGFTLARDAKKAEREFLDQYAEQCNMSFSAFYEIYIADCRKRLKSSTVVVKKSMFEKSILPYLGKHGMDEITPAAIRKWQNEILGQYGATSAKNINSQLSALFNFACRFYGLKQNPVRIAGSIGDTRSDIAQYWTITEFRLAMFHIHDLADKTAITLLFYSGLRVGELLALNVGDYDRRAFILRVFKTLAKGERGKVIQTPKTKKSNRSIVIPYVAIEALNKYINALYEPQEGDRLFSMTREHLLKILKDAAAAAGVPIIRLHDLRHSHASILINNNVNIKAISERLGHENIETTLNIYGHLYKGQDADIANLLNAL